MNERVRLLAEQAEKLKRDEVSYREKVHNRYCTGDMEEEIFREKFAELIVRECAGLAKTKSNFIAEQAMKYSEDTDEETSAKATAWQFLVFEQEIKKHFGVE